MGIIGRTGEVITANVHAMLDRFENPERMLKQAIREMQQGLSDQQRELARVMAEGKLMLQLQAENERQIVHWTKHVVSCVRAGDDDLARQAIVRRRSLQSRAAELKSQQQEAERLRHCLAEKHRHMQETVREAGRKLGTLSVHRRAAELHSRLALINTSLAGSPALASQLNRLRRKVERAEAEAQALERFASAAHRPVPHGGADAARSEPTEAEMQRMKRGF